MADLDQAISISIIGHDALSPVAGTAAASLQKLQAAASEGAGAFGRMFDSVNQGIGMAAGLLIFDRIGAGISAAAGAAIGFNQTLDGARATMSRFFDSTDSVNNSIASLNDLAAKTPFAFEGLLTAQQRTIGAARSADELKLNMDAIAVASANTGKVSTANMDRISLALGQMQAKGHLAGGEMLQLTEAGVNMGEILAKHFGVSTAAIQKMVTEGKIGSQDVFQALRENAADPRNREALDKLAKTWEGALSTIGDVGRTVIAGTFRPFFDLMTEGAVAVADFLQSADFKVWAEAARLGFEAISAGVKGLLESLAPLGQAISTAFGQATQGDFGAAFSTLSAGFSEQLGIIASSITEFSRGMFGAGADLIGEFANGIMQGGVAAVQGAVDAVATIIASFLIGSSPPPAGPLSTIDRAGQTLMETYGQGMQQGLGPAKAAVEALDDQIRGISRTIADLDFEQTGLKNTIDDIKRGYEDQLRPLKSALELLEQQGEETRKQADLQFKLRELDLREAQIKAQGDPTRRAQIQGDIDSLKNREKELGLRDSIADVERQKQKLTEDGKKTQLDDLQYARQRHDLEQRLTDAKDKSQRASIEGQIKEIDLRHKIALDQRATDQEDTKRKLAQLDLRGQELAKEKELGDLEDKNALAQIAKDKAALDVDKGRAGIENARADIEKERQKQDLLGQARALKDAEQERLDPLQQQLVAVQRQKQEVEETRKHLQLQKADLQDVVQGYQEAERAAKAAAKAGGAPVAGAPVGGIHFDLSAAQKEAEEKVKAWGGTLATRISEGLKEHGGQILQAGIGAVLGGLAFGPLGAIVGGALAPAIWASVNEKLKADGFDTSPVITQIAEGAEAGDWHRAGVALWSGLAGAWNATWKEFTNLDNAITSWVNIQIKRIEWDQLGRELGGAIGRWLTGSTKDGTDQAADDIVRLDTDALSNGISTFFSAALDAAWEAILQHWRAQEPGSGYGKVFMDGLDAGGWVAALHAVDVKLLEEWNAHRQADYDNLIAWNQKKTDELIRAYADWHVRQQGVIDDLVAQWNAHRQADAERWNAWTADIGQKLSDAWAVIAKSAGDAWGAVHDAIGAKLNEIGALFAASISAWVQAGTDILAGLQQGIANALSGFWDWIKTNLVDQIPQFIRDILNLDHDTGAMALVGERMVRELEIGMENRWPKLEALLGRLGNRLGGMVGGDVDGWLQAALAITGVSPDWLPGLRRLVGWESSGNPTAVNETEVAGQHASGLLQTLPSTFRAYRLDELPNDIFNPIANAAASIRYIKDTYGSVYNIPGIADDDHGAFPGYGEGGVAWHKQLAWVGEDEPEVIAPISQIRPAHSGGNDYDKLAAAIAKVLPRSGDTFNLVGTSEELLARAEAKQALQRAMTEPLRG